MSSTHKGKKKSKKKVSHDKKSMHIIELDSQTFDVFQQLKQSFAEMIQGDIEDNDVVNILVQGFIESAQAESENYDDCQGCECHDNEDMGCGC